MISEPGCRDLLEIGGGRSPLLGPEEWETSGVNYTVSDISQPELDLADGRYRKVCMDIGGEIAGEAQYDLIFSKMVFEHVRNARRAYENIFTLLRPGGAALNFHPVLYSPPFVINKVLPEWLSAAVLRVFFPRRTDTGAPKFPAYYKWCVATEGTERRLRQVGFSQAYAIPVHGHAYFRSIPGLREVDRALSGWAQRTGKSRLASYAYTIVVK